MSEAARLLSFAAAARDPTGGFALLDAEGRAEVDQPIYTFVTARMTHAFALGHLLGFETAPLADHGVEALVTSLRDTTDGGWFTFVRRDGTSPTDKEAYALVHVILGASSAVDARRPNARRLLDAALDVLNRHFWDERAGAVVDSWSRGWRVLDDYRGANANMHAVEALLAASAAAGSARCLEQALRILDRFVNHAARDNDWRMPEHYTAAWIADRSFNADAPFDMFKPYGVTPGHLFEWAKLCCQAAAAAGPSAPSWLVPAARRLFARAAADGWLVDGAPGLVYTVDWDGSPRARQRLHWVLAEAIGAAALLAQTTGEATYRDWYRTWWAFAEEHLIDREQGSWRHELDATLEPSSTIVAGKPDVYHSLQACLYALVPPGPSIAAALASDPGPSADGGAEPGHRLGVGPEPGADTGE